MNFKTLLGVVNRLKKAKNNNQSSGEYAGNLVNDLSQLNKINSIKGQARKSIAQFPVLISENVSAEMAPIITHAIEVENATLVSIILQNTDSFSSGGVSSVVGTVHRESSFLPGSESVHELYEANKALLVPYEENFNMRSLNEGYYTKDMMMYFNEAKNNQKNNKADENRKAQKHRWEGEDQERKRNKEERDAEAHEWKRQDREDKAKADADRDARDAARDARDAERDSREREKYDSERKRTGANVLTQPKDINKMNDLQPTVLNVEVNFRDPKANSDAVITKKVSIGIKCVSHLVKSKDVEYYLTKAAYKNNIFLKLIKFTTGEIKFWKDLVFALDDIKKKATYSAKTNSEDQFANLEFTAKNAKALLVAGASKGDLPTAITSLLVSKSDLENIKYKEGIDIMKDPSAIKKIFSSYYLLNFMVVDEALEVVYCYDAETNTMESKSFRAFEDVSKKREVNANDLYKVLK